MKNTAVITALLGVIAGILLAPLVLADSHDDAKATILKKFPELINADVTESPIEGLYEVRLGAQVTYVSADARYLIEGQIINVNTGQNLTEARRMEVRAEAVDQLGDSSMIVFGPSSAKHTVTVFTDIDCGYCRKLHREINDYNDEDIRVRYLFFPRSGPNTESWNKADRVWCSVDRNAALTAAKAGKPLSAEDCGATPVAQHYELGRKFGIRGTPAIVLESGEIVPGYVPASELAAQLAK